MISPFMTSSIEFGSTLLLIINSADIGKGIFSLPSYRYWNSQYNCTFVYVLYFTIVHKYLTKKKGDNRVHIYTILFYHINTIS